MTCVQPTCKYQFCWECSGDYHTSTTCMRPKIKVDNNAILSFDEYDRQCANHFLARKVALQGKTITFKLLEQAQHASEATLLKVIMEGWELLAETQSALAHSCIVMLNRKSAKIKFLFIGLKSLAQGLQEKFEESWIANNVHSSPSSSFDAFPLADAKIAIRNLRTRLKDYLLCARTEILVEKKRDVLRFRKSSGNNSMSSGRTMQSLTFDVSNPSTIATDQSGGDDKMERFDIKTFEHYQQTVQQLLGSDSIVAQQLLSVDADTVQNLGLTSTMLRVFGSSVFGNAFANSRDVYSPSSLTYYLSVDRNNNDKCEQPKKSSYVNVNYNTTNLTDTRLGADYEKASDNIEKPSSKLQKSPVYCNNNHTTTSDSTEMYGRSVKLALETASAAVTASNTYFADSNSRPGASIGNESNWQRAVDFQWNFPRNHHFGSDVGTTTITNATRATAITYRSNPNNDDSNQVHLSASVGVGRYLPAPDLFSGLDTETGISLNRSSVNRQSSSSTSTQATTRNSAGDNASMNAGGDASSSGATNNWSSWFNNARNSRVASSIDSESDMRADGEYDTAQSIFDSITNTHSTVYTPNYPRVRPPAVSNPRQPMNDYSTGRSSEDDMFATITASSAINTNVRTGSNAAVYRGPLDSDSDDRSNDDDMYAIATATDPLDSDDEGNSTTS